MVTIGLMSIIDGVIYLTPFGTENFSFPEFLPITPINMGGVSISWTQLAGVIITFLLIAAFSWFFKKSTLGISMRAVSDDQLASMSIGISVPKVFRICLGYCGPERGCGRGDYRKHNRTEFPRHSMPLRIVVFPVVILGGLDSDFRCGCCWYNNGAYSAVRSRIS